MLMRRLAGFSALSVAMTSLLVGCFGGSTTPALAPVTGTVEVDGAPTGGVTVMFNPAESTKSTGASGVTGPDGKYQLLHRSGEPGIEPGTYQVTFSRLLAAGKPIPPGVSPTDAGATESLPAGYLTPTNPMYKVEVKPEGGAFDYSISTSKKK